MRQIISGVLRFNWHLLDVHQKFSMHGLEAEAFLRLRNRLTLSGRGSASSTLPTITSLIWMHDFYVVPYRVLLAHLPLQVSIIGTCSYQDATFRFLRVPVGFKMEG